MKRLAMVACVALMAMWSITGLAANFRMGVVNMKQVVQQSSEFKEMGKSLEQEFSGDKTKIEKMGMQLRASLQKFQKNKAVMSQAQMKKAKEAITQQEIHLRREQMQVRQRLFKAQSEKMMAFMGKIKQAIADIAKKHKLTLVLPKSTALYAKDTVNITDAVIKKLG